MMWNRILLYESEFVPTQVAQVSNFYRTISQAFIKSLNDNIYINIFLKK